MKDKALSQLPKAQQRGVGENAGAAVPDQQVNPGIPHYPVDRYLVERSNKFELDNIIDDDIWNAEPAMRPEDEILLKKLHDMLQSTADDLKLLSGELLQNKELGVHVKSLPTPLDEDFNEKVHIEEIVNAKFHGYKVIEKPTQPAVAHTQRGSIDGQIKAETTNMRKSKRVTSTGIQVNQVPMPKKPIKKNLALSRTNIVHIDEHVNASHGITTDGNQRKDKKKPSVAYNEFSFKYVEPKIEVPFQKPLQVQNMPSINIRSELKEQKVLQLNIIPDVNVADEQEVIKSNVAVISAHHEPINLQQTVPTNNDQVQYSKVPKTNIIQEPTRKVSKMSSCESSESINYVNIGIHTDRKVKPHNREAKSVRLPAKSGLENIKNKRNMGNKRDSAKRSNAVLDEWKKKLNTVYGCPTTSRKVKSNKHVTLNRAKKVETKSSSPVCSQPSKNTNALNNAEYIPYSKLTLGGVRIGDIEKELSNVPNRNDIPLSPILDKILSRENSFRNESQVVDTHVESPKILSTSDENLLREVLDIEKKVNKTLSKNVTDVNISSSNISPNNNHNSNGNEDQDSYIDDFEDDDKSDYSPVNVKNQSSEVGSENKTDESSDDDENNKSFKIIDDNMQNKTTTKALNLSLKNEVDIFEYIHSINTQEIGTQSHNTQHISLKETQTSPRNDKCNVQPIHNDLWPSLDPKGEVEKLFQIEKEFIRKLIVDEYGDLLEKNINKPSTSKDNQTSHEKNVVASQKNTQTSPAHVKSVMTSPTKTKTRTTSPFAMSLTFDKQTSPMILEELKINNDDGDELGISLNLSSPRFSLRLPQTCRDVLSNLESHHQSKVNQNQLKSTRESGTVRKNVMSSSSSADGDYSSSDISSLGEIRFNLKSRLRKLRVPSISELSSSSLSKCSSDNSGAVIPLRSEGEVSLDRISRKKSNKSHKSEGEMSLGRLY